MYFDCFYVASNNAPGFSDYLKVFLFVIQNLDFSMEVGLVSIVVPTFNVGELVSDTIESVISQDYQNWELIIVDDASVDNTIEVLNRYAKKDSRISIFCNAVNSGSGVTRNVGIKNSKGQYLAFLDSDDLWEVEKLTKQLSFMTENSAAISHTSFSFIDVKGLKRKGRVDVSHLVGLEDNLRRTEIGTSTAIIDRSLVKGDIFFSPIRARQDLKLWVDLLSRGYHSLGLNEDLVKYRVRNGSVSSNKFKMLWITFGVYMGIKSIPLKRRLSCYFSYVANAISKRT